jgi:formate dehydrogenase subunit beta
MTVTDETETLKEFEPKNSLIPIKNDLINGLNSFFQDLLSKTDIEGLIIPTRLQNGSGYIPALITEPEQLENANALAPIMPVNSSKAVMDLTRLTPVQKTIGVVLKPCESRAVVELEKLKQINIENLIIIGIDCPGTVSLKTFKGKTADPDKKPEEVFDDLLNIFSNSKEYPELRSACKVCEQFTPGFSDIEIGLFGQDTKKSIVLRVKSQAGQDVLEPLGIEFGDKANKAQKARADAVGDLGKNRAAAAAEMVEETEKSIKGLDNFMTVLSSCINCHNCMTVCPICYCQECFFESPTFNLESEKYLQLAAHKGAMRLPANMFLFHVTRFNHMVLSCVACGMCEQGCPAEIPLLSIYKTVGKNAQKEFDYEPGHSLDEEIPILTFKEDELEPR